MTGNPAWQALRSHQPALPAAIAFSGGADSTALLRAACATWPGQVQAIHVHHGLQPAADAFASHCEAVCAHLHLPLRTVRVDARHRGGQSPEEAARNARYLALAEVARESGMRSVLLAQHADDQVETLLLALGRGAGVAGLAAMPAHFERHGMRFERPLLSTPGAELRDWLLRSGIKWVEDPSNADPQRMRNRIRHVLVPAVAQVFPHYRETFARSARHAAQAQELLSSLAERDLQEMGGQPLIVPLQAMPRSRQANLLRHWLRTAHGTGASDAQIGELLSQTHACRTRGHQIQLRVGTGTVQRTGERLSFIRTI